MAGPYLPTVKNVEYIFYIGLEDFNNPGKLKAAPTLADGDIVVSTDGGAFENVNAYSVTPASGKGVKITLSSTQMNGDNILVIWDDQTSPAEWAGGWRSLQTANGDFTATQKASINAEVVDVIRTDTIPDSYAAHEAQPTMAQAVLGILQFLTEKSVSSTTVSVKKPDGSTAVMEFTLDSATAPTSITRKANP